MTNRDILAAATAHFAACRGHATELQALGILGAVGSSEPPPDPWRGISGPPGPLTPYGRRIASMQANLETHFGTAAIEWSEPNDPAAWAKPGTPVMQRLVEEIDLWSAVVRDRDSRIASEEREILVLRAERDAWQKMHADLNTRFQAIAPADWGHGVVPMTQYVELEGQNSALKAALDLVREESRKDVDWISAEWREVIAIKDAEIVALKAGIADARMLKADETGNHDYIGPVKDGKAVPDPTHERFHGSVGDVIAGNVMRPARDQMERALADARVKDGKTPPPFPSAHAIPDHRRIGS